MPEHFLCDIEGKSFAAVLHLPIFYNYVLCKLLIKIELLFFDGDKVFQIFESSRQNYSIFIMLALSFLKKKKKKKKKKKNS